MNPLSCFTIILACCIIATVVASDFSGRRNPSGNRPHSTRSNPSDDQDDYYRLLGVEKTSTSRQITSAYRKKAVSMHPDKGGDAEQFKKLVEAYEVLSDESKRRTYDRFGKTGTHSASTNTRYDEAEAFRDLFRGFSGFGVQMPVLYNMELSLEDIFSGKDIVVTIFKSQVTVRVTPGMVEGTQLGADVGGRQVVFVLQQRRHPVFTRKRHDLLMKLKVSLADALLGFERSITHLDGSQVTVCSPQGRVTGKNDVFALEGLGMPFPDDRLGRRGDLFVLVEVEMPEKVQLTAEDRAVLQRIFGPQSHPLSSPGAGRRKAVLRPADIRKFGRGGRSGDQTYSSDFGFDFDSTDVDDEGDKGFTSFSSFFFR